MLEKYKTFLVQNYSSLGMFGEPIDSIRAPLVGSVN
jgi:hypothetical protein